MAAFVVADGGDKASAAIYNVPGVVVSEAMAAFKDEMTRLCPDALCPPSMLIRQWGIPAVSDRSRDRVELGASTLYLVPVFDRWLLVIAAAVAERALSWRRS